MYRPTDFNSLPDTKTQKTGSDQLFFFSRQLSLSKMISQILLNSDTIFCNFLHWNLKSNTFLVSIVIKCKGTDPFLFKKSLFLLYLVVYNFKDFVYIDFVFTSFRIDRFELCSILETPILMCNHDDCFDIMWQLIKRNQVDRNKGLKRLKRYYHETSQQVHGYSSW